MQRLMNFVKTTLLGGAVVMLPFALMMFLFQWILKWITALISPFADILIEKHNMPEFIATIIGLFIIFTLCFVVGIMVKTRLGKWFYEKTEMFFLHKVPGYLMIKDTVGLFFNNTKTPFSSVALVRIYSNATLMSAFITDDHMDGRTTVFVPTGPNPTSGNIYHLDAENVYPLNISVEDAMRSIIGCGAGSAKLLEVYRQKYETDKK